MKYPGDMAPLTKDLKLPKSTKPSDLPASKTNCLKVAIWKKMVASYCTRVDYLKSNLKAAYAIIWGQCSNAMKAKLKTLYASTQKNQDNDCVWLLNKIKTIVYQFKGQRYIFLSLDMAENTFSAYRQGLDELLSNYLHNFRSLVKVFEHYGGSFGNHPALVKNVKACNTTPTYPKEICTKSQDRAIALAFLRRANHRHFGVMWAELENQFTHGTDQYPANLSAAYSLLVNYQGAPCSQQQQNHNQSPTLQSATSTVTTTTSKASGLTFAQTGSGPLAGTVGVLHAHITCFTCNLKGHYASVCPGPASGVQLLQMSDQHSQHSQFTFAQQRNPTGIPNTWVLLNSQLNISVFKNAALLQNICPSTTSLTVCTNGGTQVSSMIGDVPNFGLVWYNTELLANILSLAEVRKSQEITMDTAIEPAICVHKKDGSIMKFIEFDSGLYHYDTAPSGPAFVQTVEEIKARFHKQEVEGADRALALYRRLRRPSQRQFGDVLAQGFIPKCPGTVADAKGSRSSTDH